MCLFSLGTQFPKKVSLLPFCCRKLLIFYRIVANILVVIVLASSTYAIYQVVERSKKFEKIKEEGGEVSWWDTNEVQTQVISERVSFTFSSWIQVLWETWVFMVLFQVTIVMSLITALFPSIFEIIGIIERYHPRSSLRLQLARYGIGRTYKNTFCSAQQLSGPVFSQGFLCCSSLFTEFLFCTC